MILWWIFMWKIRKILEKPSEIFMTTTLHCFRCYNSDRSLFCGVNNNFEPYVCCPSSYQPPSYQPQGSGPNFDTPERLNGGCGKTLIQGSFYKKLGSSPFVARIGFKSESSCKTVWVIFRQWFLQTLTQATWPIRVLVLSSQSESFSRRFAGIVSVAPFDLSKNLSELHIALWRRRIPTDFLLFASVNLTSRKTRIALSPGASAPLQP